MPSLTTGIAFDVAAASMPRKSASASIVVTPGVSTSSGAPSGSGNVGARGTAARDLDVGGVVAVLAGDERVLARAAGARKPTLSFPPMIPLSAWTSYVSRPQRSKIFLYAPRFALEALASALASSRSNE